MERHTFIKTQKSTFSLFLFVVITLIFTSCEVKDIVLEEVEDVRIDSIVGNDISGTINVSLTNPNSFAVTLESADFKLFAGKAEVGKAKLSEPFKINANTTESYPIRMHGDIEGALSGGIGSIVGVLMGKDPKITIKGEIQASSYFIRKTVPVDLETDLTLSSFMR